MKYFIVNVQFTVEDSKKLKKKVYSYVVNSMSVTEAEAKITQYLREKGEQEFEVVSAVSSKIAEVVL